MNILYTIHNFLVKSVYAAADDGGGSVGADISVVPGQKRIGLGFTTPSITEAISFAMRFLFIVAGFIALVYLILGALAWVTSGGNKENVSKAQEKIQAAVVGLVVLVLVIAVIAAIEQWVFAGKLCLGLTCALEIPGLLR